MRLFIYTISILILAACELVVPIDLPDQSPKLVLNGFLQADSSISVYLTSSFGMYETFNPAPIDDATITLRDGQGNDFLFTEDAQQRARYSLDNVFVQPGERYTITAAAPGFPSVTGSTIVPLPIRFDTVELDRGARMDRDSILYDVWTLQLTDIPQTDNYFILRIRLQEQTEEYGVCFETLDPALAAVDFFGNGSDALYLCDGYFTDAIFKDGTYRMQVFTDAFYTDKPNVTFQFDLLHVDEAYYNYAQSSALQYSTDGNPFAEPVIVYNNIEQGFGVIGSYVVTSYRFNP